jgi:diadenosine tetraphosphate (Ap4A) HIT family hydrolase
MSAPSPVSDCPLCTQPGGEVLARDERLRVVLADEPQHPAFVRVIWNAHVAETCDLEASDRDHLMRVVFEVERGLRDGMRPDKINLASLGNVVPHLHWHVIGRWRDDPTFPGSVWSAPAVRDPALVAERTARSREALALLKALLRERLSVVGLREFR